VPGEPSEETAVPATNPVLCGSIAGRPGTFGVAMHNAAYRALGLNYTYVAFGSDDTAGAVAAMRALAIRGLGVTMPHKIRIIEHLDAVDETARAIGAVNTVVNDDGRLTGHNVDWIGAVRAFREKTELAGRRAAVIGAGGGARSIVYGLVREGCRVTVYNRGEDHGRALAEAMGAAYGGGPAALIDAAPYDLIAHATPVGFHDPEAMLVPAEALRTDTVVFDAVPMPIETRLLREAAARGCRTLPGVRMQIHQATRQFALYTGVEPDFAVMETALLAAMDRAG
jgi:shikimate dehydrogenase